MNIHSQGLFFTKQIFQNLILMTKGKLHTKSQYNRRNDIFLWETLYFIFLQSVKVQEFSPQIE